MNNTGLDRTVKFFLVNLGILISLGLVMVFSSSYMYAKENFGSSTYFILRQIIFLLIGGGLAFVISRMKVNYIYQHSYKIHIVACALLLLTLMPGIGVSIKGAHRWVNMGFFLFQPGELVKLTTMFVGLRFFENFARYTSTEKMKSLCILFLPLVIFLIQPDFGSFVILFCILGFTAFLSSFPRIYLILSGVAGAVISFIILFAAPYRVKRILAFLDPWEDPRGSGFQIIQSFLAFANGSWLGQGLGNSNEKLFYLPEAYNDFIFSVIGEELGLIGVVFVILLFMAFIFWGLKIALNLKSRLSSLIVACCIFVIGLQGFLNMGVVLALLPTKGLNLPFISYGGSSLITNMIMIGLIMACIKSKNSSKEETFNPNQQTSFKKIIRT